MADTIYFSGKEREINTDFIIGLYIWHCMDSNFLKEGELIQLMTRMLLGTDELGLDSEYGELIMWFGNKQQQDTNSNQSTNNNSDQIFCPKRDWHTLWVSIKKTFGYDINKDIIHWHTFLAMFNDIVSGVDLTKVVEIRNYKYDKKHDSKEYKDYMERLKSMYSLKTNHIPMKKVNAVDHAYQIMKRAKNV